MTGFADHIDAPARSSPPPTDTVQLKHPGRAIAAVIAVFLAVVLLVSLVTNHRYQWSVVWHYLFNPQILQGLGRTLILTVAAMTIAFVLGIVLAACRLSDTWRSAIPPADLVFAGRLRTGRPVAAAS